MNARTSKRSNRLAILLVVGSAASCVAGCSAYDWVFAAMQPHYSGGGVDALEQKRHFDEQVEAYRSQQSAEAHEMSQAQHAVAE